MMVGQYDFLIPVGATITETLRQHPDVGVVVDSAAWPPDNPERPSLDAYVDDLLAWRHADGSWGNLNWAAAYDHIRDPGRTQQDDYRLLGALADAGAEDCPIVPVTHYPGDAVMTIFIDFWHGPAGARADVVAHGGDLIRPGYAIGGLVPPLMPTQPRAVFDAATEWYADLVRELEQMVEEDGIDEGLLQIHVFGIGRPSFVLRSPLVSSCDSSGPVQMARFGWQNIQPRYNLRYGLSPEKLQQSREARLAYWLMEYRARLGLGWRPVRDKDFRDDRVKPQFVQHSLFDLLNAPAA